MTRAIVGVLLTCTGLLAFPNVVSSQAPAPIAGKWEITIRMPERSLTEQWTIQQKGKAITATAKGERGDMPVAGSIEGLFLRVTVKDGVKEYKVRATVDGDAMDGSITMGVGTEHLWHAKRAKTK